MKPYVLESDIDGRSAPSIGSEGRQVLQSNVKRKSLGLCLGASTVMAVELEERPVALKSSEKSGIVVQKHLVIPHNGNPKDNLNKVISQFNIDSFDSIAATGRKFRNFLNFSSIPEPEAVEHAYRILKPSGINCPAIVSAGGETFMVYVLNQMGQITNVLTGNKCASGTGEFFLQQLRRMDVTLEEAAKWAAATEPYHVSGRCSVFCKSDCTHATNKGVPKARVTAGLCKMMAHKIVELLKKVEKKHIMLVGGVAKNQMMVEYLKEEIEGLIVPAEAPYFEALGAALWALSADTQKVSSQKTFFKKDVSSFDVLPPLQQFKEKVEFKTMPTDAIKQGDTCLLGLDVGSTTTKAVLLRQQDKALLASVYLRTNGDPVRASRACYRAIYDQIQAQIDPATLSIIGLGVCGSGRQIAGLHALTDGIINEIIAHAEAAVFFDPAVDTIFEIGGQDAKYTYVTNGVASDYAMNEACSAGTGSFLEESAYETLGVRMENIAAIARKGEHPPNFNDQCAAFIASDIKNAIHEGIGQEDILAGLVYSVCVNYTNRVKGNRPVGGKVFMQGGVCYNNAVPLAMASLTGKPIIVPPEPGLMGAFGVALAVSHRIDSGLMPEKRFDLKALMEREVAHGQSFICKGGKEKCDRRCEIARVEIENETYPFGGACNRYYNLRQNIRVDVGSLEYVRIRQELIFQKYGQYLPSPKVKSRRGKMGINRSFMVNTFFPLYSTFFTELGFEIILPDKPDSKGIDARNAAFCFPAELGHGFMHALLSAESDLDYIFLPHFKAIPAQNDFQMSQVCPLVQGETYYLQSTFKQKIEAVLPNKTHVLAPVIDATKGLDAMREAMVGAALQIGVARSKAAAAFKKALQTQLECLAEMKSLGRSALETLRANPDLTAVVLFGRPYNGFAPEGHMGIPYKLASRGIMVLPFDFLEFDDEKPKPHMYWGMGQLILKAARVVSRHPQMYGTYVTNFSCGPDSFLVGYFRKIMKLKPSLTLELDSHTADAGLETRIEAFLDIIRAYSQLNAKAPIRSQTNGYRPAKVVTRNGGRPMVVASNGEIVGMDDPRVTFLLPSMGETSSEALAAAFRHAGFNAKAHQPADEEILKLGRANTSCKECLPLLLTTGYLLNYVQKEQQKGEILVYFMATASGPCRFGQYFVFLEDLLQKLKIEDTALFSLTSENAYGGLSNDFQKRAYWGIVIGDQMEDIRSMLLANAVDTEKALVVFKKEWHAIVRSLEGKDYRRIEKQLLASALNLKQIKLKKPPHQVPLISLAGEMFVRREGLSRQHLTERLAQKGFATLCAPINEWLEYSDFLVEAGLTEKLMTPLEMFFFRIRNRFKKRYEKRIKALLAHSGLVSSSPLDFKAILMRGKSYISPQLAGEAILTIGGAFNEVGTHTCGAVAIGPFGCMLNRISESILNEVFTPAIKLDTEPQKRRPLKAVLGEIEDLPFLAIESDGSPFPQLIEAKLETFCLRAERLHGAMMKAGAET